MMTASPSPSALTFSFAAAAEDVDDPVAPSKSLATISCPLCGAATVARDDSVVCLSCLAGVADWKKPLEEHIKRYPKVLSFSRCSECGRVCASDEHRQQSRWIEAEHESEELMGLLLRKIRSALLGKRAVSAIQGMSRALGSGELSLEDARFVWTEPHSRRVVLEVVVAHSVAKLGQRSTRHKCSISFTEERKRCNSCVEPRKGKMGSSGGGDFAAKIQIRPLKGIGGRRTLRGLEDAIVASKAATAARRASNGGLDVEFMSRADAAKFLSDLKRLGKAPLKFSEASRKLVTHDEHSNSSEWQLTTLISVPPIDKHDLCFSQHDSAFYLVLAVRTTLRIVDVATCVERDVGAEAFFKKPFEAVASTKDMVQFVVSALDEGSSGRQLYASREKANDDEEHATETGRRKRPFYAPFDCKPGKAYLGYDLETISHRVQIGKAVPTVVLVVPAPIGSNNNNETRLDDSTNTPSSDQLHTLSRKEKRKLKQRQAARAAREAKEEPSASSSPPIPSHKDEEDWWSDETRED